MQLTEVDSLEAVPADAWNRLLGPDPNPFLTHEFLSALERHGCVGGHWGWQPRHLLVRQGDTLVGAAPLYLKDNSYGELVFDWAWADAYRRAGQRYYPKLVSAVPYTPAPGPRLLVAPGTDREAVRRRLHEGALALAEELRVSTLHWLFTDADDTAFLERQGLHRRVGCQFHWHNAGYDDFDAFLARFSAHKRKKLKRERRQVSDAGIVLEVFDGRSADERHWDTFHRFYVDTFRRLGGYATLTAPFFKEVAQRLPEAMVLVMARHGERYVAGALSLRNATTLYGRHWGCEEQYDGLHFEACYYAGIDYCIRHGLQRFEPGAQGEHKVGRGFEPVATWSAHWVAHPGLGRAIADFVERERVLMDDYMTEMRGHLPFKAEVPDA